MGKVPCLETAEGFISESYAVGNQFTRADIYVFYTFTLATAIIQKVFAEDLLSEATAIRDLVERLREWPSIAAVEAAKG